MKKLLFGNPVFHSGINVTCRAGLKWADTLGQTVDVADVENEVECGEAKIVGVLVTELENIPESVLQLEHDPACRTKEGIEKELRTIYGNLSDDATITVLFFEM